MLSTSESRELDGIRRGLDACLGESAASELSWRGGAGSALAAAAAAHRRFADPAAYLWVGAIDAPPGSLAAMRRALGRTCVALATGREIDAVRTARGRATAYVEGSAMPLSDVVREIRHERDASRRRRLAAALETARAELTRIEGRALGAAWDALRRLGHESTSAALASWHGADVGTQGAAAFLDHSTDLARELVVGDAQRALGIRRAELRREDLAHHLQGWPLRAELWHPFLPALASGTLEAAGIPRSVLARIRHARSGGDRATLSAATIALQPPLEVVMDVDPGGGVRQHGVHLRELGRAVALAAGDAAWPVERRRCPDEVAGRALGLVLEGLLGNAAFLRRALRVARPRDFARLPRAVRLARARAQAARLLFHDELERGGRIDRAAEPHAELAGRALLVPAGQVPELDFPEEAALWLAALPWSLALADTLQERFDEDWFRNPRTGPFLLALYGGLEAADVARLEAEAGPAPRGEALARRLEREEGP